MTTGKHLTGGAAIGHLLGGAPSYDAPGGVIVLADFTGDPLPEDQTPESWGMERPFGMAAEAE